MRSLQIKRIVVSAIFLTLLALGVWIFLQVSRPYLEVGVTGEHNPIKNSVSIDNARAFPSGEGGVIYKSRVGVGTHTVTLRGPFIKTAEATVSLSFFGKQTLELKSEPWAPEDIARSVMNDATVEIRDVRLFDESIVFSVFSEQVLDEAGDDSYPVVLYYDQDVNTWKRLNDQGLSGTGEIKIPDDVAEYFYELENE